MLLFAFTLLIIDSIITFFIMKSIVEMIWGLKDGYFKYKLAVIFLHPATSFCMNFMISSILAMFTGAGMVSGFANLGSSIIMAFLFPFILKIKGYAPENIKRKKHN